MDQRSRDPIERALAHAAGFHHPRADVDRWYREAVEAGFPPTDAADMIWTASLLEMDPGAPTTRAAFRAHRRQGLAILARGGGDAAVFERAAPVDSVDHPTFNPRIFHAIARAGLGDDRLTMALYRLCERSQHTPPAVHGARCEALGLDPRRFGSVIISPALFLARELDTSRHAAKRILADLIARRLGAQMDGILYLSAERLIELDASATDDERERARSMPWPPWSGPEAPKPCG